VRPKVGKTLGRPALPTISIKERQGQTENLFEQYAGVSDEHSSFRNKATAPGHVQRKLDCCSKTSQLKDSAAFQGALLDCSAKRGTLRRQDRWGPVERAPSSGQFTRKDETRWGSQMPYAMFHKSASHELRWSDKNHSFSLGRKERKRKNTRTHRGAREHDLTHMTQGACDKITSRPIFTSENRSSAARLQKKPGVHLSLTLEEMLKEHGLLIQKS